MQNGLHMNINISLSFDLFWSQNGSHCFNKTFCSNINFVFLYLAIIIDILYCMRGCFVLNSEKKVPVGANNQIIMMLKYPSVRG